MKRQSVDPAIFLYAWRLGNANFLPHVESSVLTDHPYNRWMQEVWKTIDDSNVSAAVIARITALMDILRVLPSKYRTETDGMMQIHTSVVHAAAECPMKESGKFSRKRFLSYLPENPK